MKITGLTRRVDSLGRIVIPKELRRMLHMEGDPPVNIYGCRRDDSAKENIRRWEASKKYITGICTEPVKGNWCHGMCGRQDEIIAAAVILCAYAEQGDKLEIVEKLVSAEAEFPARQLG